MGHSSHRKRRHGSRDSYRLRSRGRSRSYDSHDEDDYGHRRTRRKHTSDSSSNRRDPRRKDYKDSESKSKHATEELGLAALAPYLLGSTPGQEEHIKKDPPSYEESQAQDRKDTDVEKAGESNKKKKSRGSCWAIWEAAPVIPLLTAVLLLFLITCSSSSLRADFAVLKVTLSSSDFSALYTATKSQPISTDNSSTSALEVESSLTKRDDAGFLTLGIWGWCVVSNDWSQEACSDTSGWFDLDDLFEQSVDSGLNAGDFNSFLVHCLVFPGNALLVAMLAVVPVGLQVWRQYWRKDFHSKAGWFQHGTILAAGLLSSFAWVIDKLLHHTVSDRASSYKVTSGPAETMVGVSAILLLLAFLLSVAPGIFRFVKNKRAYLRQFTQLTTSSHHTMLEHGDSGEHDIESERRSERRRRRRRRGGRSDGLRRRVTTMFGRDGSGRHPRHRRHR